MVPFGRALGADINPFDVLARLARGEGVNDLARLGGLAGLQEVVRVVDTMVRLNSPSAARATLRVADDFRDAARISDITDLRTLGRALHNLQDLRYDIWITAFDSFRLPNGNLKPGLLEPAQGAVVGTIRPTANITRVGSRTTVPNPPPPPKSGSLHEALEVVGTRWLIDNARRIEILAQTRYGPTRIRAFPAGDLPAITDDAVESFGRKALSRYYVNRPGDNARVPTETTFEGDTVLSLTLTRSNGTTADTRVYVDWKNRGTRPEIATEVRRALTAVNNPVGGLDHLPIHIVFLNPLRFGEDSARAVRNAEVVVHPAQRGLFPDGRHVILGHLPGRRGTRGELEHFIAD